MEKKLLELIKKIQLDRRLISFDEAATKQIVILRILSCLGWDTFNIDEVHPEYSVGGKRVDYALRHNNYNKVFIEVKKVGEDLEKHQEQLLNYSFQEGVKLAVLTNGITWWLYLPLLEGSWEQRKFYTVEIYDQDSEEITLKFINFLSNENVISGKAIDNAENIYKSRQKQYLIKETLPKAWNKIIEGPDETLIELIAETTEKLCGYRPEHTIVERFITSNIHRIEHPSLQKPSVVTPQPTIVLPKRPLKIGESYAYKSISLFLFKGTRYEVRSWKDMLIQVCNIMLTTHRDRFEQVLNLRGRKRPYFTRNPNELRAPEKINGTDIYVEVNLSANSIVKLSIDILSLFVDIQKRTFQLRYDRIMRPTVGNTAKYDRGRSFGGFLLHFYNILRNYNMLNVETPMFFTSKKLSIKIFGILLSKCYNFVIIKNIDEMVVLK